MSYLECDPRLWPRAHRIALLLAMMLGFVLAMLVGFKMSGDYSFWDWVRPRTPYQTALNTMWQGYWAFGGGISWGGLGALAGAAVIYIVKLLR